jgi:RND family efflux transporter MFP subunit
VAEVVTVKRGTATSAVYGTVKIQPTVKMLVRSRNTGAVRLAQMSTGAEIVAGMEVKEGWTLMRIETPEMDRELTKMEADLKAAEERGRLGPPSAQLLKTAEAGLARLEKLAELRNAPASEVEKSRNEVQALRERVRSEQVEIDRLLTTIREAAAGLRDRKARCEVKAPMNGMLAAIMVVSGDLVVEGAPLFAVCTKTTFIEGYVNEEDVGALKKGLKAVVRLYAYQNKDFNATLTDIIPAGENQRYMVRLAFDEPPDNLMAGMTGEMNVILGKREGALLIPTRALMSDRVWVVDAGKVRPRAVKTGLRTLERTEILEGLKEGEQVVVADLDVFRANQWVQTVVVSR